jgi:hypothetical protein
VAYSLCFVGHRSCDVSIHRRAPPHTKLAGATPVTVSRGRRYPMVHHGAPDPLLTRAASREPSSADAAVDWPSARSHSSTIDFDPVHTHMAPDVDDWSTSQWLHGLTDRVHLVIYLFLVKSHYSRNFK